MFDSNFSRQVTPTPTPQSLESPPSQVVPPAPAPTTFSPSVTPANPVLPAADLRPQMFEPAAAQAQPGFSPILANIPSIAVGSTAQPQDLPQSLAAQPPKFKMPFNLGWLYKSVGVFAVLLLIMAGFSALHHKNTPGSNANATQLAKSNQSLKITNDSSAEQSTLELNVNTNVSQGRKFTATGQVAIQNEADSTHAFSVQNSAGQNLLVADTTNSRVGIGGAPTTGEAKLQVTGDISTSGALVSTANSFTLNDKGLYIGNTLVCTINGCSSSAAGSANTIDAASLTYLNRSQTFSGINHFTSGSNTFSGDGSGLSALSAGNITSGTLADGHLSANVALLDANNAFSGNNTFSGNFLFQSATNSASAFQIQNAAGNDNLLVSDTINTRIGIGVAAPNYTLDVNGDINVSAGHTFRIDGTNICANGLCNPSSGSSFYVNNSVALQTATNFNIQSAGSTSVGGIIRGASGQTADLFEAQSSGGSSVFMLDPAGNVNITGQYKINGATICTSSGCTVASGSGAYIQNGVALQATANFNIESTSTSDVVGILKGKSGQTADILQAKDGNGAVVLSVGNQGQALFKDSSAGSHTFFQIQNSSNVSLLSADTITGQILLPNANVSSTALLIGGNANLYAPSNNNLKTDNNLTVAGNLAVNGAGLFKNSADSTAAFQIQNASGASLLGLDTTNSIVMLGQTTGGNLGAWTTNANSLAPREQATSIIDNGYIYEIGGYGGSASSIVYYAKLNADGSTGTWSTSNSLPTALRVQSTVVANNYVYAIGGLSGPGITQSTVYYAKLNTNGSTGTWSTSSNALPAARAYATSVTANGYAYVLGGDNSSGTPQSTVYYAKLNADGSTGAWTTSANPLPAIRDETASITANGFVYVLGGYGQGTCTFGRCSTVYYAKLNADGSTGAWTTSANPLPVGMYNHTVTTYNHYVYVLGGFNGSTQSTVYYAKLNADGTTGTWSTGSNPLPSVRASATSVTANGFVYVLGGDNGSVTQNTVYYASIQGITRNSGQQNVADQLTVGNSLTVDNGLTVVGNTTLQASIDSTSIFNIQNASGSSLVNVDSTNSNISLGQAIEGPLGAWGINTNPLPADDSYAPSVVANGYVYILGGDKDNTIQSTVYYAKLNADGSTGAWTTSNNSLPQALYGNTSVALNGYMYLMGGKDSSGTPQSTVYYAKLNADGSTGAWTTSNNSLPAGRAFATSVTANGYVYVMAGIGSTGDTSTTYYAKLNTDGSTGAWATSTNVLPQVLDSATSITTNGYVYVMGGADYNIQSTVYYAKLNADGSTGAWTTSNNSLPQALYLASSVIANGYVYVMGGANDSVQSTVYYAKLNADGSTGAWINSVNMLPQPRRGATSVTANGYVYVMGGANDTFQSTVYYASVSSMTRNFGQENIADQLTVGNGLTVAGNTSLQATTDSTSAFSVQNSSGSNLINVDSTNSIITLAGNNSGALGSWGTNANTLPQTLESASSVTANGYVYVLGGDNNGTNQSTVYYAKLNADGSTGAWTTNANALPAALSRANSVTANGYVYVLDGFSGGAARSTVYYAKLNADGSTGTWTTNANALPGIRYFASSVVANGYAYVMGGRDQSGTNFSTVYYAKLNADGSTGTWTTNANGGPATQNGASAVTANGYVYIIGGFSGSTQSTVYYAKLNTDGSTGTWQTNTNALPAALAYHSSIVTNGYIYTIGGQGPASTVYYAKLNTDGSTGTWQTNTNALPATRVFHGSVVANGYVYVLDGDSGTSDSNSKSTVYYTSTSRIQIGANLDLVGLQGGTLSNPGDQSLGSTGGSITAGNITAVGGLQVQGQGSFAQGLSANGNLTIGGSALFQNSANSTTAFQIQNATGTSLLTADTSGMGITIGGSLSVAGNITISSGYLITSSTSMYASSLPGSPVNGQEIYYKADATNGVIWHLRYDSSLRSGSGAWAFLGGSPLYIKDATGGSAGDSSVHDTGATLTLPLAGVYNFQYGGKAATSASGQAAELSLNVQSTIVDNVSIQSSTGAWLYSMAGQQQTSVTSASSVAKVQYGGGGGNGSYSQAYVSATPVYVY